MSSTPGATHQIVIMCIIGCSMWRARVPRADGTVGRNSRCRECSARACVAAVVGDRDVGVLEDVVRVVIEPTALASSVGRVGRHRCRWLGFSAVWRRRRRRSSPTSVAVGRDVRASSTWSVGPDFRVAHVPACRSSHRDRGPVFHDLGFRARRRWMASANGERERLGQCVTGCCAPPLCPVVDHARERAGAPAWRETLRLAAMLS